MKKWPIAVAVLVGLGAAFLAFGPGLEREPEKQPAPEVRERTPGKVEPSVEAAEAKDVHQRPSDEPPREAQDAATEAAWRDSLTNPPPAGTLRPENKAELALKARNARPFNKHHDHVAAYWTRAAMIMNKTDTEVAGECGRMGRYLQDQSRLDDTMLDVNATLKLELELAARLTQTTEDPEMQEILDYVQRSAQVALDGGDPSTVSKVARP